jgi:hypothetical protein
MNVRKIIFATTSYFILTMAIAYPWHLILFNDLYEEMGAFTRDEPIIPLGMLAITIQGIVIAYLYPCWYKKGNPVINGVKFSLIIGLMVYTVMGFTMAAKIDIKPVSTFLFFNTMFQFLQFTVTGVALGLIYGRKGESV